VARDYVRQLPTYAAGPVQPNAGLRRLHIDPILLVLLACISGFGLVVLFSAAGSDFDLLKRQGIYLSLGFAVMIVAAQFNLDTYRRWAPAIYLFALLLLILVMLVGTGAKGAQRWLSLGGFRFQPSEIMKLSMPLALAAYLSAVDLPPRLIVIGMALALIGIPALLIGQQPDLGTALLIAVSGFFVLFMAGISWRLLASAVVLVLLSIWPM
jgi:rod shape determining protein RodA